MLKNYNENVSLIFLDGLNAQQKEAVIDRRFPQLILSGAGSGKTTVLISKIIYLMKIENISPENVLALTFTRKAADEMKIRIAKYIGERMTKRLEMGTFHSIFNKILRKNISFLRSIYNSDYKIIEEKEVNKIIKNIITTQFNQVVKIIMEKKGGNDKVTYYYELDSLVKRIAKKIMLLKSKGITYEDYNKLEKEIEKDKERGLLYFNNIYQTYEELCQKKNVMDFEDLLLNTLLLFKKDKNILSFYQNKFQYILIDEYQDTNNIQFQILKELSLNSRNICGVGDDYQSIYSFRGATLSNISNYIKVFPDVTIFKLCQNYRSNSNIVKVSNQLIKNNNKQIKKELFSNKKETDGNVTILENKTGYDETIAISDIIKGLIYEKKCKYKDIAILYRLNIQCYPFQKMFFKKNIPYNINNRIGFYETKIIKNIYAYLKFVMVPKSNFYLNKIINYPQKDINDSEQNYLFSLAKSKNISGWEIIKSSDDWKKMEEYKINRTLQSGLMHLKIKILKIMTILDNKRVYDIVYELINILNLRKHLKNDKSSLEKMDMLLEKISELEEEYNNFGIEYYTLKEFLDQMSFFIEDKDSLDNENKVKLMTIHQAKGLEFKYVFVVGLEDGFYPLSYYKNEDEIEEERRILYVAITRAKEKCYISYSNERILGTDKVKRVPSRFISEIYNKELVEIYKPQLSEEKIEEKNRVNNNNPQIKEINLIYKKENKIELRATNINYKINNEKRIDFMKSNDNRNNNNLNFGESKDIQNEGEEINSLLNDYLISKDLFDFLEREKKNSEVLEEFKVLNKKRKFQDK